MERSTVPSPCIGICRFDDASGYCLGCARTRDELGEWPDASDERRSEIWSALPRRFRELGLTLTRLPWSSERIVSFAADSLRRRAGTWVLGCYGATAEFMIGDDEASDVSLDGHTVTAICEKGALRLSLGEHVRALELRDHRAAAGYRAIFLVVPTSRATLPVAEGLTPLGPDAQALRAERRRDRLFDLGLGRPALRFCIRTSDATLLAALAAAEGLPLPALMATCGAAILTHSPERVVETALGRAEIGTAIPPPGGQSPEGPHTHLLPGHLAANRATEPGIELPPVYALGATFYPRPDSE